MQSSKNDLAYRAAAALTCLFAVRTAAVWAAPVESAAAGGALDEIVVTATKRTENLQVVPLTVDVVTLAMLQSQNLTDTSQLKRLVPDLEFRHGGLPGQDAFNIRGIETLATAYGSEQSAGVAFDGVPLARGLGAVNDLVDVRSVEVLMGPQGMLFGKNASAGLVNIVTNLPQIGKTETNLRASFGSLNLRQYSGTLNAAIGDESALRVTAWKFTNDGPIHEVNTGQDMNNKNSDGARAKYRWTPTQDLDLNLSAEWDAHHENGAGYTIREFVPSMFNARTNSGALVQAYELAQGTVPSDHNLTARGLNESYYDIGHANAYTGQADYRVGDGTVTAIASYRQVASAGSFDPYPSSNPYTQQFLNTDTANYQQLSEELRYASPVSDRLHYVVGLFNFRMSLHDSLNFGLGGLIPPIGFVQFINANFEEDLQNKSYAGFGEATFDLTPQLHLIAGLRRSTDKLNASMDRSGPVTAALGGPFISSTSTTYNDLSWRLGVQYQMLPDMMLYATASKGYKGPGVGYTLGTGAGEVRATNGDIVKPEIAHAYEAGIKSQWLDQRLTLNLSVFQQYFDDFQTSVALPGNPFASTATTNAPQVTSSGADLSVRWAVTRFFSLAGTEAYTHARYTDFPNASCYNGEPAQAAPATGLGSTPGICYGNLYQNAKGLRVADSPRESFNITARFEHPLTAQWSGYIQPNSSYRSNISYSSTGDPLLQQGGYTLFNFSAGINSVDGRWGLSVYGNNVFNKHYVDTVVANGSLDAVIFQDIGYQDLRTFGASLNVRF
ncbi:MAG: TonB-dependent receptor [Pseudomonadota bacterium]|nr:TonB-dependent receptor [Pseudomonadota bacterium]